MFFMMLFILFLGLKLGAIITWSWWLVFTPIIIKVTKEFLQILLKEAYKMDVKFAVRFCDWLNS